MFSKITKVTKKTIIFQSRKQEVGKGQLGRKHKPACLWEKWLDASVTSTTGRIKKLKLARSRDDKVKQLIKSGGKGEGMVAVH